jgi:hypothetical protein
MTEDQQAAVVQAEAVAKKMRELDAELQALRPRLPDDYETPRAIEGLPAGIEWVRVALLAEAVRTATPRNATKVALGTALLILLHHCGYALLPQAAPEGEAAELAAIAAWFEDVRRAAPDYAAPGGPADG